MMKLLRGAAFLVISLILGEIVKRVLYSGAGEAVTNRLGRPELSTLEGATEAGKEARRVVGFVRTLTEPKAAAEAPMVVAPRTPGWVGTARDAAELFLAAGALLRTASEFASEDEKLRRKITRISRPATAR